MVKNQKPPWNFSLKNNLNYQVFQALDLIKRQKLKNIQIENVGNAAQHQESDMSKESIYEFFEEMENDHHGQNSKKIKANFFAFTLEQLKNVLKIWNKGGFY